MPEPELFPLRSVPVNDPLVPGRPAEGAGAQPVEFGVGLLLFGFSFVIVHVYLISAEA